VAGWELPASWLQNVNPILIIIFAPVFGWLWTWLAARNVSPSAPLKFVLGLFGLAAGFFVISWGAANASETGRVSMSWLAVTYFLHTVGELCLSPVGLSSMTKLAPRGRVGQMMGTAGEHSHRTRAAADGSQPERRVGVRRPGSDPEKFGGIAKVNMTTGEIQRFYEGRAPGNGATLATAGDLIFWGDLNQKLRAFDADTGKILWETTLGGPIQNSTITYRVNGKQYVAVLTGLGAVTTTLFSRAGANGINPQRNTAIHVFALP